ncbi:MAG TPA: hypothetical protein VF168_06205 [Trueperaceae bacterium]
MPDTGGIAGIREAVRDVTSLAREKGRDQTFEFELYLLKWQAELAETNDSEELEGLVLREAEALRSQIEKMTAA